MSQDQQVGEEEQALMSFAVIRNTRGPRLMFTLLDGRVADVR